jgi:RNA 3'-terminal phosphate cyclase
MTLIVIDGALGEGGGQVVRTSLTGKPFRIENTRAKRAKPGLLRQHLTVNASVKIGEGAELRAMTLTFVPRAVRAGALSLRHRHRRVEDARAAGDPAAARTRRSNRSEDA